jgi:hypothetical protein
MHPAAVRYPRRPYFIKDDAVTYVQEVQPWILSDADMLTCRVLGSCQTRESRASCDSMVT